MKFRTFDKTDGLLGLMLVLGLAVMALGLASCTSADVLPATQAYAEQVARDNAAAAQEGNPFSMVLTGLGTLVASLAGAVGLVRRFDKKPFLAEDGQKVSEDELACLAIAARKDEPSV